MIEEKWEAWEQLGLVRAKISYIATQLLYGPLTEEQMQDLSAYVAAERLTKLKLRKLLDTEDECRNQLQADQAR